MRQKIKQVKFEWKEIFKTDMEIAYRVTCIISTEEGKVVEASEILKLFKGMPIPISQGDASSASKLTEVAAYNSAVDLLKASDSN